MLILNTWRTKREVDSTVPAKIVEISIPSLASLSNFAIINHSCQTKLYLPINIIRYYQCIR